MWQFELIQLKISYISFESTRILNCYNSKNTNQIKIQLIIINDRLIYIIIKNYILMDWDLRLTLFI